MRCAGVLISIFRADESGSASVEFALIAPILIAAVLSVADLGLSIHERAEIDQALRNGAERAVSDPGVPFVEATLDAVYEKDTGGDNAIFIVNRFCACPESSSMATGCYSLCSDNRPPSVYYELSGTSEYNGFLLPAQTLLRTSTVQTR